MSDPLAAVEPPRPERTGRRWRPSLQLYLLALAGLVVLGAVVGMAFVRDRNTTEALDDATGRADFRAELAAAEINEALAAGQRQVAELAANPGLRALFAAPTPEGCTLTFAGAGPFKTGRLDIVDRSGRVLCSSDDVPLEPRYAGQSWLRSLRDESQIIGPVDDPATGEPSLLAIAPIDDLGVVALFLELGTVPGELGDSFGQPFNATFALTDAQNRVLVGSDEEADAIVGEAEMEPLGWTARATIDPDLALANVRDLNRQISVFVLGGLILLMAAVQLLYRAIARPIERLSAAVSSTVPGQASASTSSPGPAEVRSLAAEFETRDRLVAEELARRSAAEDAARASAEGYRTLFENNPQPMWVHHRHTRQLLAVNEAMVRRFGRSREDLLAMHAEDLLVDGTSSPLFDELAAQERVERSGPWKLRGADDELIDCEITSNVLELAGQPGRLVVAEDVTAKLRNRRLLQQAQRMESLGQLAGGIAHDFNNILAVMMNYADFAADELRDAATLDATRWQPVLQDVEQIGAAGRRAAELTQQLLSFARGETSAIEPIDLGTVAANLESMLARTLGEQVQLELDLASDLWAISGNTGQLEQILVNLAVNARDAMPDGGRLSIDAQNIDVDEHHVADRPELTPGRYVRLRVSDTGVGMDPTTRDRAFEPFFTTKQAGNGTGLGLATVYGIVSRAGGTIHIYSEPGLGTTISVLFPASELTATPATPPNAPRRVGATETVLVVEDDDNLREIAKRILSSNGYHVLTASDGPEALALAGERPGQIDLLLTDVVMPKMPGIELARTMRAQNPDLRLLFMSGYAPPVLTGGTLPHDAPLIDKPFSAALLLENVRAVLDGAATPATPPA